MIEEREHSWYEELVPAYALGMADEAERQKLAAHLKVCAACRKHAAEYDQLQEALLYSAPPAEARAGLTEGLRKRMRAQAPPASRAPWWAALLRALSQPGFALGLVAIALLLGTNIYWAGRTTRAEREVAALAQLTQTPGVVLAPSEPDSHASAIVYVQPASNVALLCVYDLPSLEPGKTYQAWLIEDERRVSGGTFRVDEDGYGVLLIQSEKPLGEFDGLGITVEPEGGSNAPTTPRVMGGSL